MSAESLFRSGCASCGFVELNVAREEEYGAEWWHVFMELPDIPYGDAAFYTVECTPEEAEARYDIATFARLLASQADAGNIDSVEVFNLSEDPARYALLVVITFYLPVSAGPVAGHPSIFCAATLEALGMRLRKMGLASMYNSLTPHVTRIPGFCFGLDLDDAEAVLGEKEIA